MPSSTAAKIARARRECNEQVEAARSSTFDSDNHVQQSRHAIERSLRLLAETVGSARS